MVDTFEEHDGSINFGVPEKALFRPFYDEIAILGSVCLKVQDKRFTMSY